MVELKYHQELIKKYKENNKTLARFTTKALILEIFVVLIVCGMKTIQSKATIQLNALATTFVGILLSWHFWNFKSRRILYEKNTEIILNGIKIEKQNTFSQLSFFRTYLKKFNIIGQITKMALFDIILIYFFSVSHTQLLKSINPGIIVKLRLISPISSLIISAYLAWLYYQPLKPLSDIKKAEVL